MADVDWVADLLKVFHRDYPAIAAEGELKALDLVGHRLQFLSPAIRLKCIMQVFEQEAHS